MSFLNFVKTLKKEILHPQFISPYFTNIVEESILRIVESDTTPTNCLFNSCDETGERMYFAYQDITSDDVKKLARFFSETCGDQSLKQIYVTEEAEIKEKQLKRAHYFEISSEIAVNEILPRLKIAIDRRMTEEPDAMEAYRKESKIDHEVKNCKILFKIDKLMNDLVKNCYSQLASNLLEIFFSDIKTKIEQYENHFSLHNCGAGEQQVVESLHLYEKMFQKALSEYEAGKKLHKQVVKYKTEIEYRLEQRRQQFQNQQVLAKFLGTFKSVDESEKKAAELPKNTGSCRII